MGNEYTNDHTTATEDQASEDRAKPDRTGNGAQEKTPPQDSPRQFTDWASI